MSQAEAKVLAAALYEVRILLGTAAAPEAPYETRLAFHLAYALHNDALAVIEGGGFDVEAALDRIARIDQIIGGNDGQRIADQIRKELSGT